MQINLATIELVQRFEGCKTTAYNDPVGVLTIGYGYTNNAGYGDGVRVGDVWSEAKCEAMLLEGLELFAQEITLLFTRKPNQNQFGAMLSLAYNIGVTAFKNSTCLKRFNAGDIEGAAEALTWFNKAGGRVLNGLVRRRSAERELFLTDAPIESTPKADGEKKASTTLIASVGGTATTIGGVFTALSKLDTTAQYIVLGFAVLTLLSLGWIARERLRKWAAGDR